MKHLIINSPAFKQVLQEFADWLLILNYSTSMVEAYPNCINEMLHFLEKKGINKVEKIKPKHLQEFITVFKSRPNKNGGKLSAAYINYMIKAINKFSAYLSVTKQGNIQIELNRETEIQKERDIITIPEIKALFNSINDNYPLGERDKAILAILYGAGLRKHELETLNIEDISFTNQTIHVKHGKGNKERLIPVTKFILNIINKYIIGCRSTHIQIAAKTSSALFIDIHGNRMNEYAYYSIIENMIKKSEISTLQKKHISLHTFRHSIATHFMLEGMDIYLVSKFLGHNSLNSTMIYTHLVEQLKYESI